MKKLILIVLVVYHSISLFAQAELTELQHQGLIEFNNGAVFRGIIETDLNTPWDVQNNVFFYREELLSKSKIRKRDMHIAKARDVSYVIIDEVKYEVVKYTDFSFAGIASVPQLYLLELVADGKIKLYKYYHTPIFVGNKNKVRKSWKYCQENPEYVICAEGEKAMAVQNIDLKEYLRDCPEVYTKYLNGEYGNPKVDPNQSGYMAIVHTDASIKKLKEVIVPIINDYNAQVEVTLSANNE